MKTAGGLTKLLVSIEDDKVITFKSIWPGMFSFLSYNCFFRRQAETGHRVFY